MDLFSYTYPGFDPTRGQPASHEPSGGLLGDDGFLSKAGETFIDLLGLYGQNEIEKSRLKTQTNQRNPEIEASQSRAGVVPQFIVDNRTPYIVGGAIVAGVALAIFILRK